MNHKSKTIGIYHKNCSDGTMAAAVLLKKLPNIYLFPLSHEHTKEEFKQIKKLVTDDTIVYTVDCALGIEKLIPIAKEVITIDHHIGNKEYLESLAIKNKNFSFIFNNNNSGSSLTWSYFFKEPVPEIIQMIEDFDLWRWKFGEKTKYLMNFLYPTPNNPEKFLHYLSENIENLIHNGKYISNFTDSLVYKFIENNPEKLLLKIGPHKVLAVNSPFFQSEIGNFLVEKNNEAVAIFKIQGTKVFISFRSKDTINPSALTLAQTINGGGHKNASAGNITLEEFCKMLVV